MEIRQRIWDLLEAKNLARFPRPVHGRIPNYVGSEKAASALTELDVFKKARRVKVNPDAPQRPVRFNALLQGKVLYMPTPRLREGFLVLDSTTIPKNARKLAASIGGAFKYGEKLGLSDLSQVDAIVVGSVAVSQNGARVGKGEGYSEIEYAILRQLGVVDERTKVLTTVHDVQVVNAIPVEEHDVPVDVIMTPTRVIVAEDMPPKPHGILWRKITDDMLDDMPMLKELKLRTL